MSLLTGLTPPSKIRGCFVANAAENLSAEDQKILYAAVSDPNWSLHALERALNDRGVKLSRTVIERHRKRLCNCA